MNKNVKIIANYLPQYHAIPQNDEWWGEGFTDWNAVKRAQPLYTGHLQPKEPLHDNYYSLDQVANIKWQAELAKEYGIYGFGIYHYWFSSSLQLLQKPAELLLNDLSIDMNFMFIWDNGSWKRTWSNVRGANDWAPQVDNDVSKNHEGNGLLAKLIYGDENDWKIHFDYLLPFFKDSRYIKKDNKPLFGFFQPQREYEKVISMCAYWNTLAQENGFDGIHFISKYNYEKKLFDYSFLYEPTGFVSFKDVTVNRARNVINRNFPGVLKYRKLNYNRIWKNIFKKAEKFKRSNVYYGAFVGYDDTPRRGNKGLIISDSTPERFEKNLQKLIALSSKYEKEFIFLTAWNEWGEGAYLEPDKINGFQYLEAVKKALTENKL